MSNVQKSHATEEAIQALRDELYDMNEPEDSFAALTDEFANVKRIDGRRDLAEAFIGSDWLNEQLANARRAALLEAADALEPLVDNQHDAALNPETWLRDRAYEMTEGGA